LIIILAVLALVIVNALAESPWGVFSIGLMIPIALFMGYYLHHLRPGRVSEVTAVGRCHRPAGWLEPIVPAVRHLHPAARRHRSHPLVTLLIKHGKGEVGVDPRRGP